MKLTWYKVYRVLMLLVIISWVLPDLFVGNPIADKIHEFWYAKNLYYAIVAVAIFDLGWCVGYAVKEREMKKRCTLRHANDPKRHNFVGAQCNSSEPSRDYKETVIEQLNQEIKK